MTLRQKICTIAFMIILIIGGALRFYKLGEPAEYVFDEVYHVPTVRLIARGDPRAYEWWHKELTDEFGSGTYVDWLHPPLAKLLAALSAKILGENFWACRLPSAVLGTLLIAVVYLLARTLYPEAPEVGVIAAALVSIDGLAVSMSRIVMNDILVTVWAALALWAYWQWCHHAGRARYLWATVIFTGLAASTKWSGWLLFPFFAAWELIQSVIWEKYGERQVFARLCFLGLASFGIYLFSYIQAFILGHGLRHWLQLHAQILGYQFHLKDTHEYASRAYQWPLGYKPVYLYYDQSNGLRLWNTPFYPSWYLALGAGLAQVMNVMANFYQTALRPKKVTKREHFGRRLAKFCQQNEREIYLLLGYFALWTPWIFSPRIMYLHHYLPALPMLWVVAGAMIATLLGCPIRETPGEIGS